MKTYTATEAAELLGITRSGLIQKAIRRGIGQPPEQAQWSFTESDLDALRRDGKPGRPKSTPTPIETEKEN